MQVTFYDKFRADQWGDTLLQCQFMRPLLHYIVRELKTSFFPINYIQAFK
jgi:hypothetical protein